MDFGYVKALQDQLRHLLFGLHTKMTEIEALRYYEDEIQLNPEEGPTGLEVHIGLTAELIENVKSALTANMPYVNVRGHRTGDASETNMTKREKFWNEWVKWVNYPTQTLIELADGQISLGMGVAKAFYRPWPTKDRYKKKDESDKDYLSRQKAQKQAWGPPFGLICIHPTSYFFRNGPSGKVTESVEHSYKFKLDVYGRYIKESDKVDRTSLTASAGQPDNWVQALPADIDTSTMVLVDEYLNDNLYQIYAQGKLEFEETKPSVAYFIASGRVTSSKDPDKWAISVAEPLRTNEPILNRTFTRMAEGADLLVRRRLALEIPEGTVIAPGFEKESGDPTTLNIELQNDSIAALPSGATIKDPFEGAYHVYDAMPFANTMMGVMAQHGVAPIFKGITHPGSSGYDNNSSYAMAAAQFQYLIDSYKNCLSQIITWYEWCLVNHCKQEVWCGQYSLSPSDITDWPATIEVEVEPSLPQNFIAKGEFMDRMQARGHITRNRVREDGIGLKHPEEEAKAVLLEQVVDALRPILIQDVVATVLQRVPQPDPQGNQDPNTIAGGQGDNMRGSDSGRQMGGFASQGRDRMPPNLPAEFPTGQREPR